MSLISHIAYVVTAALYSRRIVTTRALVAAVQFAERHNDI